MIFDGVKAITIPEGPVKKIHCSGKLLWEKPMEVVCDPVITIGKYTVDATYAPGLGHFAYNAQLEAAITGISASLIQSVELMFCKNTGNGQYAEKSSRAISYASDRNTHTIAASFTQAETYLDVKIRMKYNDLDGELQTLDSAPVNATVQNGIVL